MNTQAQNGGKMTTSELTTLRKEVNALYIRRINHDLSDEEADDYFQKDRLLFNMEKAARKNLEHITECPDCGGQVDHPAGKIDWSCPECGAYEGTRYE